MSGASDFYKGPRGAEYFAWQRTIGIAGGRIEARKFASSVRLTDVVLDFGCGGASMLRALECARRIGVDASPAARREAAAAGVDVHESLTAVASGSVDVVVSNHALEHALDPYDVCRELRRVLRPGGKLVLCVPFDDLLRGRSYDVSDRHHHLFTWSPQLLGNLLFEAGFTEISCRRLRHAWPPGWRWLDGHLTVATFDRLCAVWSIVSRLPQVVAHAVSPPDEPLHGRGDE
jgi:SAM-dependent methyltransferase